MDETRASAGSLAVTGRNPALGEGRIDATAVTWDNGYLDARLADVRGQCKRCSTTVVFSGTSFSYGGARASRRSRTGARARSRCRRDAAERVRGEPTCERRSSPWRSALRARRVRSASSTRVCVAASCPGASVPSPFPVRSNTLFATPATTSSVSPASVLPVASDSGAHRCRSSRTDRSPRGWRASPRSSCRCEPARRPGRRRRDRPRRARAGSPPSRRTARRASAPLPLRRVRPWHGRTRLPA